MKKLRRFVDVLYVITTYIGVISLVGMFVITVVNVLMRNFSGKSIAWSDGMSTLMMAWFSMLALALGVRMQTHVSLNAFADLFKSPKFQKVNDIIVKIIVMIFGAVLTVFGINLIYSTRNAVMSATGLPNAAKYIMMPVAGVLIVLTCIVDIFDPQDMVDFRQVFVGRKLVKEEEDYLAKQQADALVVAEERAKLRVAQEAQERQDDLEKGGKE